MSDEECSRLRVLQDKLEKMPDLKVSHLIRLHGSNDYVNVEVINFNFAKFFSGKSIEGEDMQGFLE